WSRYEMAPMDRLCSVGGWGRWNSRRRAQPGLVSETADADHWRLLLSGSLAGIAVGARHGQHSQTRHGVRPHGRVCLVFHGAAGGQLSIRLVGKERRIGGKAGDEGDPMYAERDSTDLADAQAS